jgi:hypothetical protein
MAVPALLLRRGALRGLKASSPSVFGARWSSHDADAVYEQMRRRELQEYAGWRQGGQAATAAGWRRVAYPPTSHRVSHTLEQFVKDFDSLKVKEKAQRSVQLSGASCGHGALCAAAARTGRIVGRRDASKKLIFLDIASGSTGTY